MILQGKKDSMENIKNLFRGITLLPLSIIIFSPFIVFGVFIYLLLSIVSIFYIPLSTRLYRYSHNMAKSIDQLANASIFGNIDQTISGRLGKKIYLQKSTNVVYATICKLLNIFFHQDNHCKDAIEYDRIDKKG